MCFYIQIITCIYTGFLDISIKILNFANYGKTNLYHARSIIHHTSNYYTYIYHRFYSCYCIFPNTHLFDLCVDKYDL